MNDYSVVAISLAVNGLLQAITEDDNEKISYFMDRLRGYAGGYPDEWANFLHFHDDTMKEGLHSNAVIQGWIEGDK